MRFRKEINMNSLVIIFMVGITGMVLGSDIRSKVMEYYRGDAVRNFKKIWRNFQTPYENSLKLALQSGYGHKGLNVYINRLAENLELAKGYIHCDNQVKVLFHRLVMVEIPELYDVDVTFPLASHMISVEATVSKMIVEAYYIAFRNSTDLIYSMSDQNPYQSSPFRFQQVSPMGNIAISLEGCTIQGFAVATLSGHSVNLGHPSFKLKDCQFITEIGDDLSKGPPVIAHYLFSGPGINLDTLALRPLLAELMPKLQAAVFSYVNTTALFEDLPKIRGKQHNIFQEVYKYEDTIGRCMVEKTLESQYMGTAQMPDFVIPETDTKTDIPSTFFAITNVSLLGLDTIYSSHAGGPVKCETQIFAEQIRFKTLQVTGLIGKASFQDQFAGEIVDLAVNVELDQSFKLSYNVVGWRVLEFSTFSKYRDLTEAFVVAYLQKELPKIVIDHLESVYLSCDKMNRD